MDNAQLQVKVAYKNFFNSSGFPKFRSKKDNYQTYTPNNQKGSVRTENGKIKLPKIGFVKIKCHRKVKGIIKSVTIFKTPSGKYFVEISRYVCYYTNKYKSRGKNSGN